jgi:hypothetical protein
MGRNHDEAAQTGQNAFYGKPLARAGRWVWVFVPMTECGEAKQGKPPKRKQEHQKIFVLPASKEHSQHGCRKNGRQHPLVKSAVRKKTAAHEREGDQKNWHQKTMDSTYTSQGHRDTIQCDLPF